MATDIEVKEMEASPELEKALNEATSSDQIKEILAAEAARISGDVVDAAVTNKAQEVDSPADEETSGQSFHEDIVIGGQSYHLEGDSPSDIIRQIKAATTAHDAATKPKQEVKAEASTGLTADEKVSLDLDYRMGKISLDSYLEKSGALDAYLEKKGLKVDELKDVVQEKISSRTNNQWEIAVEEFKQANPDWVPNQQNMTVMKYKLVDLGLTAPSADNLSKGFAAMKAEGLVFSTPAETKEPTKKKASGSSVFGIGSGSKQTVAATTTKATVPAITADMSPQEIMRIYNETATAQGMHPDDLLRNPSRR